MQWYTCLECIVWINKKHCLGWNYTTAQTVCMPIHWFQTGVSGTVTIRFLPCVPISSLPDKGLRDSPRLSESEWSIRGESSRSGGFLGLHEEASLVVFVLEVWPGVEDSCFSVASTGVSAALLPRRGSCESCDISDECWYVVAVEWGGGR